MNLLNKTFCLLIFGFLAVENFPQAQSFISINGNINNSFPKRSIYNVSTFYPFKNNKSAEVLDSLICIYSNGIKIKIAYNYKSDLSLDYFTIADWVNGEWIISNKHTDTYNSNGILESVVWEWFNPSSGEWIKVAQDVYNYDSLGNQITYLHQIYDGQEFINDFRYEYFYNTTNNLTLSLEEFWNNGKWVNDSKVIYKYNNTNLKDTTLFQNWKNYQWVNNQLNIYEYDEELNIISNLAKKWDGNNWLNLGRGTYDYDINNNCVLEYWEIANNNIWENWFRIFYEYGDKNNLIHLFGEEWVYGQWISQDEPLRITNPDGIIIGFLAKELFLYYSPSTSVESENNIVTRFNLLQNYPNPFNPATTIRYEIPERSFVTIKVIDLLGNEVAILVNEEKLSGVYEVEFNASNLPDGKAGLSSGIYFYQLQAGEFISTKKLVLLK